jgi:DNA mismatch repair ATPase MutL
MVGHLVRIMAKLLYEGVALPDGLIPTATQEDLFGATLHVTSTVYRWVEDHQDELAERSISLSPLGGNTLSVSGLPSHLNLAALQAHLEEVVSQSGPQGNRDYDAQLWDLCQRRARAAVANGLNPAMVSTIVVALHRTTLPHFTPSGGLTMVPYAVEEINRRFNRRVDDPR